MSILNIRKAERTGAKVVIGIAGVSGSGKTYTALKIARGMVDDPAHIGFIDTENKRGSLYSDILDGSFLIGDLYPPFSPQRYADAIKEFQNAGVKVLVVDSVSHEWEGDGGCEDIANAPLMQGKRMADWKRAKSEHKKFMNALLQSDMHIIACIRAREKTDFSNPKEPKSLGIQPITEKNFMFEMTASMMMWDEGKSQQFMKMPEALRNIFGSGSGYLGENVGAGIMNWVDTGTKVNTDISKWESELQMSCEGGVNSLKACWNKVPNNLKPHLENYKDQCKSSAVAFDDQRKQNQQVSQESIASKLNTQEPVNNDHQDPIDESEVF